MLMAKKRTKPVSFDAMVKFFMQHYNVPTKRDVERIMTRLDQIERLIRSQKVSVRAPAAKAGKKAGGSGRITASDEVLQAIQAMPKGAGFADIQAHTGFNEKKLRNIIFRLHKLGKIKRESRGIYVAG
jgi:hypothetical protein